MAKLTKKIATLDEAVKVYGDQMKLRRAFGLTAQQWKRWCEDGVPRGHELGIYLGLRARDAEASPKLFGVESWRQLRGAWAMRVAPFPKGKNLVSETSVPTAEHLIRLIAQGQHDKREIVACKLWLRLHK